MYNTLYKRREEGEGVTPIYNDNRNISIVTYNPKPNYIISSRLLVSIIKSVGVCCDKVRYNRVYKRRDKNKFIRLSSIKDKVILPEYKQKVGNCRLFMSYSVSSLSLVIPDCSLLFMIGVYIRSKEKFNLLVFRLYEHIRIKIYMANCRFIMLYNKMIHKFKFISSVRGLKR